ncbi:hypothetical protein OHA79_37640 [Streptomyces sp. NBC_00841]|uniref:hypothetical protein n=1 Tax=unclassified Streptomyces TaxID=2593676 RepID=UPI00224D0F6F|nr:MULTISPECIES: hypothetical protein [unclassified Streptomyces]MCX4531354.1 hypothetical protein [Streptomyces sp. NBC_01669]WSA03064.1 hypothetical protein OHA79_37640 [Streptomyces sp. NBC_00841]
MIPDDETLAPVDRARRLAQSVPLTQVHGLLRALLGVEGKPDSRHLLVADEMSMAIDVTETGELVVELPQISGALSVMLRTTGVMLRTSPKTP